MRNRIESVIPGVMSALAIPGRLASSAGSALFGMKKFLAYAYHDRGDGSNFNTHPVSFLAIGANFVTNLVTRVPALFRRSPDESIEQISTDTLDDEVSDDLIDNRETDASNESSFGIKSLSVGLHILCIMSNGITSVGVMIGSYNSGKVLCEFVAAQLHEDANDEPWKYYLTHSMALYFALSNLAIYLTYVGKNLNENREKIISHLSGEKPLKINPKIATTAAIVSSLNIATGIAFNYISTTNSIKGMINDINQFPVASNEKSFDIPAWLMMALTSTNCAAGMMVDIMTTIPSLYKHIDDLLTSMMADSQPDIAEPGLPWKLTGLKMIGYSSGLIDSLMVGAQAYSSVALTLKDIVNVDPYGWVINLGLLCALSKTSCQFSFFVKKGVDDVITDCVSRMSASEDVSSRPDIEQPCIQGNDAITAKRQSKEQFNEESTLMRHDEVIAIAQGLK